MLVRLVRVAAPVAALALLSVAPLQAQAGCDGTPAYSPCELRFPLPAGSADPWASPLIQIEFRSPRFKTFLMPGYYDGRQMVVRFTPTEGGQWVYKITSSIAGLDDKEGSFTAAASDSPGFVVPANVHHWATENKQPHLWVGDVADRLAFLPAADFEAKLETTVHNKFTHLRLSILGGAGDARRVFPNGRPDEAYFAELDRRIREVNKRGIVADLVLAANPEVITALFPDWQSRQRLIRFLVARYAPMNITWQGVGEFEDYTGARALLKEIGLELKKTDPYLHPRSTNARMTSTPLLADGWMNFVISRSTAPGDDEMGSVEHQLYPVPFVGVTTAARLWSSVMDGQYVTFEGSREFEAKNWFDFIADTRHWELEPFFEVDGGRAVALEGVEYIVYVEKPGPPVEVDIEKHNYDVSWFNPLTGQEMVEKKYHGEHYTSTPPDTAHPWVLHISREGRKEHMLRSWYFESRPLLMQEVEQTLAKVPYEITSPAADELSPGTPVPYAVKIRKATRATRIMMYYWTGEIAGGPEGFRVLGTGPQGTLQVPPVLAHSDNTGVLTVRVTAINANGKAYLLDKVFQLPR
ncbi:MAG: DUF5060 domain-containing protein [Bryobacteraceae bacterium]|jgi:hypothetical protein